MIAKSPAILGMVGWSCAGKTSLLERIIPILRGSGLTVSAIKHTHHAVDLDQPGKDSYRLRQAGAAEIILAGRERFALLHENREKSQEPPPLSELVARLSPVDLVLVEGFRHEKIAKLEIYRENLGKPLFAPQDSDILAVLTDTPSAQAIIDAILPRPTLDLNDSKAISEFIVAWTRSPIERSE